MTNELATTNAETLPAELMAEMEQHQGDGMENADKDSFAKPMLSVLQKMSPQVDEDDPGHIEGAKPGKIYDNITQEVFTGFQVIPVYFERQFIEWTPRDSGGGLVGIYDRNQGEQKAANATRDGGAYILESGNILQDTRQHYVLAIKPDGSTEPAMIPMSSSQIKHSRKWITQMQSVKVTGSSGKKIVPPTYAQVYHLTTQHESNDQGSWYGWKITYDGIVQDSDTFNDAKRFYDSLKEGQPDEEF